MGEISELSLRKASRIEKFPKSPQPLPNPPLQRVADYTTLDPEIVALCAMLSEDFLAERDTWLRLLMCLKGLGEQHRQLFLDTSRRALRYDTPHDIKQNAEQWAQPLKECRINLGSLKHWARNCSPAKYFEHFKQTYAQKLSINPPMLTSNDLCDVFITDMAGDIMYSKSMKCFYTYSEAKGLWEADAVNSLFTYRMQGIIQKLIGDLPTPSGDGDLEKNKATIKRYERIMKLCDGVPLNNIIAKYLINKCTNIEDPVYFLNNQDDYLNLANGVWVFSENRLVDYNQSHYFTFKLTQKYDAAADTSLMAKAMSLWFKGDKDVIQFVQYWLGYCLTGYTSRQDLLFVWGASAGNGKSTLFNEIMGDLLGCVSENVLMAVLATPDIKNEGDNNDGLFLLNGKRYAVISEPSKTNGKVRFDEQMIKNVSGDKAISARAKYKGKITFRVTTKIAFVFNDLPLINFEDKGMERRVKVLEMNTSFLKPEDYAAATDEAKAAGEVQPRDESFIKALKANMSGVLKYLLEGSAEFMNDYKAGIEREVPVAMRQVRAKAEKTLDALGQWLDANIEKHEGSFVTGTKLRELWKTQDLFLGQGKQGFLGILKTKVESRGWMWTPGPDGKGRERITGVRIVIEDDDNE